MKRQSTTRYAIMALLTIQPMSGYDIRKALEIIGDFWHESDGQIYPTLKKLVAEGYATKTVEHQDGKPDRHVYTPTDSGQVIVTEWLSQPAAQSRLRDELLFKLFFSRLVPLEDAREQIELHQSRVQDNLAYYTQLEETMLDALKDSPDLPFRLMTVRWGIITAEATLSWCAECLEKMEEISK